MISLLKPDKFCQSNTCYGEASNDDITVKTGDKLCQSNACYGEASHDRMLVGNKSETGNNGATSIIISKTEDPKYRWKVNENKLVKYTAKNKAKNRVKKARKSDVKIGPKNTPNKLISDWLQKFKDSPVEFHKNPHWTPLGQRPS